ncbi:hypothetical protein [Cellulomonas edaphi]|uniref:Secreted protein n=1 Tax=Cellulomonas edaphi TaxID=3053468 RepID=A0ABT7S2G2_9CELL|nr:hypothetical protein [Cellulomons edaphi]MDM7829796.1 hypothetical protein [Cellulomons edaphi]
MRRSTAVLAAVAVTSAAVLASCSDPGPSAALGQARGLVTFGGPAGWIPDATPERRTDDTTTASVRGVPVTLTGGDEPAGARVRWAATATPASASVRCVQLAAWFDDAARSWHSGTDTARLAAACERDLGESGDAVIAAGAGVAHGADGRVTFEASVEAGRPVATLEFNARA